MMPATTSKEINPRTTREVYAFLPRTASSGGVGGGVRVARSKEAEVDMAMHISGVLRTKLREELDGTHDVVVRFVVDLCRVFEPCAQLNAALRTHPMKVALVARDHWHAILHMETGEELRCASHEKPADAILVAPHRSPVTHAKHPQKVKKPHL